VWKRQDGHAEEKRIMKTFFRRVEPEGYVQATVGIVKVGDTVWARM